MILLFGVCLSVAASRLSQDSNAKPTPAPVAQQPTPAPPKPAATTAGDVTPLQKAVRQKKVLTEEDLAKPVKPISPSDFDAEENNPICDLSCEAQLRAKMRFGPEREGEFQSQLTLARHDIGNDRAWNSVLETALQAAGQYCEIQRQKARIIGNGEVSQWTRNDVNSRFGERERKLSLEYRNSVGLLTQHIGTVQRFAPFRAEVMEHEVSETRNRVCPDFALP